MDIFYQGDFKQIFKFLGDSGLSVRSGDFLVETTLHYPFQSDEIENMLSNRNGWVH